MGLDEKSLVKNQYSWHKNHSIIFIDNPVGTGIRAAQCSYHVCALLVMYFNKDVTVTLMSPDGSDCIVTG